jgi:uroporphyrin-III C-methyltransferase
LNAAGIAYDIVPGVTAACAAAGRPPGSADPPSHRAPGAVRHRADVTGELPGDLNWAAPADFTR